MLITSSITSKEHLTFNIEGLDPKALADTIQTCKPTAKYFREYSGKVAVDSKLEIGSITIWLEWETDPTDELVSQFNSENSQRYAEWKLAQTSKPTEEVSE